LRQAETRDLDPGSVKVFKKVRVSSSIQLILSLSVRPCSPIGPFRFLFIFIRHNSLINSY